MKSRRTPGRSRSQYRSILHDSHTKSTRTESEDTLWEPTAHAPERGRSLTWMSLILYDRFHTELCASFQAYNFTQLKRYTTSSAWRNRETDWRSEEALMKSDISIRNFKWSCTLKSDHHATSRLPQFLCLPSPITLQSRTHLRSRFSLSWSRNSPRFVARGN